jgi:hypothetical protein
MTEPKELVVICSVQGETAANLLKSHLESKGVPVLLEYESAGRVIGITVDGLAEVRIKVPRELADDARQIIEPREACQDEDQGGLPPDDVNSS